MNISERVIKLCEEEFQVGDKVEVADLEGGTKNKVGEIKSIHASGDMADVDFGNGNIYGISFNRMKKAEGNSSEKALTSAERNALPDSDFVFPSDRSYPIPDIAHARNALARVAQHGTESQQAAVKSAVYAKFPSLKH